MELSLYHPELGYYARAARKTGRAGDFFTSVDVGPIFGELLARQLAEMWRILAANPRSRSPIPAVRSRRGGRGLWSSRPRYPRFGAAQRSRFLFRDPPVARRAIARRTRRSIGDARTSRRAFDVQRRGGARCDSWGDHRQRIARRAPHSCGGDDGKWPARGLRRSREAVASSSVCRIHRRRASPSIFLAQVRSCTSALAPRSTSAAEDWMKTASNSLTTGFIIVIDYGHDEAELYDGSHASGTLASFKQHTQFADFLQTPGECDITAHVDLTAVTRAAVRERARRARAARSDLLHAGTGDRRSRAHVASAAAGDEDTPAAWRPRKHAQSPDLRKGCRDTGAEGAIVSSAIDVRSSIVPSRSQSDWTTLPAPKQSTNAHVHREALESERREAEVAEYWHLENLEVTQNRHGVDPFGACPVVPEFPQPATNEAACEQIYQPRVSAVSNVHEERLITCMRIQRIQEKHESEEHRSGQVRRGP